MLFWLMVRIPIAPSSSRLNTAGVTRCANVIVVGQELVVPGERVDPVFEPQMTLPASLPAAGQPEDATQNPLDHNSSSAVTAATTVVASG